MWSPGVGSSYNAPARVVPQRGKVTEDGEKSVSKVSCDVLQQHVSGSNSANSVPDARPEVSGIIFALSEAGKAERLAGVSGGEPVDRLNSGPIGVLHVPIVGNLGPVVGEDRAGVLVVLDMPGVLNGSKGEL